MEMDMNTNAGAGDQFSRAIAGLPVATATDAVDLADGATIDLTAAPVRKRIGDAEVRMLAYNGSVPGPTLRVRQGSTVAINFINQGDGANTIHWHGLRLDNRYDGTHETQAPVPVGGSFRYSVTFPDPGVYWYHPHIREDYGQEMGMYGNVLVVPAETDYWAPAHREMLVMLDDVLIEDGQIAPFSRTETTYAAMGRFGNVLLANGQTDLGLSAKHGEVVRFYLTNTANTRVFNVGLSGARMKLVGGDSGRVERETFVDRVILAPSERVVIDVLFDRPGTVALEHHTPSKTYRLGTITVSEEAATPSLTAEYEVLRTNPELAAQRARIAPYLAAEPDKTLAFVAEMNLGAPEDTTGPVVYACPMHPEVVSDEPGTCPKCGMKLVAMAPTYACPMHPEVVSTEPGSCPKCGMKLLPSHVAGQAAGTHHHEAHADPDAGMHAHGHGHGHEGHQQHDAHAHHQSQGEHHSQHADPHASHAHHHGGHADHGKDATAGIEWEDEMVEVNRMTTSANTHWTVVDRTTGAAGHAIDWAFKVGDLVKIRLLNEMDSDHPMHHPFHIHGAGRFLILSRDGAVEENLMWKDTELVRTGETVDILLEVTNPGVWMAHCHIAEHHESGMMFSFRVVA